MLTAALDGARRALRARGRDARRGRRRSGAQAQPRLQPDARVRARLASSRPRRPPTTSSRRAAPASRRRSWSPTRSRSARSTPGSPAASTRPPTPRSRSTRTCARCCSRSTARSRTRRGCARWRRLRPQQIVPEIPRNAEPRTGLSMGEHAAITAARVGDRPRGAGRAGGRAATTTSPPPTTAGSLDDLVTPVPRARARPEPSSRLERREAGKAGAGVRRPGGDDDRRQLDPAQRRRLGRAAGQRGVGRRARACPSQAYLIHAQTAGVDYVHKREGLLMAPAYAMPKMLARRTDAAGLRLLRDPRGVRAQVLCTLKAWEDPVFCRERLGLESRSARSTATSSTSRRLARRRPPIRRDRRADRRRARQNARREGPGRGLISICAAGGLGVTAIMEALGMS